MIFTLTIYTQDYARDSSHCKKAKKKQKAHKLERKKEFSFYLQII